MVNITPWVRPTDHHSVSSPREIMPKATDITILEARCFFEPVQFRSPLKFGGRVMDKGCLINVEVRVETRNKRQETGFGSMPPAPAWARPSQQVSIDNAQ